MSVARTVVELEIEHAYIMQQDTEQRWERYITYEVVSRDKLHQAIGILHGGKVDQQALAHSRRQAEAAKNRLGSRKKRKQRRQRNQGAQMGVPNVPGETIKDRAYATGRSKDYDLAYTDMSGASHGGFSTLWYVTDPTDTLPIKVLIGYGKPRVKPISLALKSMLQLLELVTVDTELSALRTRVEDLLKRVLDAADSRLKERAAMPRPT